MAGCLDYSDNGVLGTSIDDASFTGLNQLGFIFIIAGLCLLLGSIYRPEMKNVPRAGLLTDFQLNDIKCVCALRLCLLNPNLFLDHLYHPLLPTYPSLPGI